MSTITRNQIISIHVCKKEAGLDTDQKYRDFLFSLTGKTSCKDLSYERANIVIGAMGRVQKPREPQKRRIVQLPEGFGSLAKRPDWIWSDATDLQWNNMGNVITIARKKGWNVVAVWDDQGNKKFKMRKF